MGRRYNWTWRGLLKRLGPVERPDEATPEEPSTPSERIEAFRAGRMRSAEDDAPEEPRE
jgi:hypothetical protein